MEFLSLLWNEGLLKPMTNALVLLYILLLQNFGASIIVFTLFMRLVTIPLTLRQLRSSKAMMELQPKLAELQKRYAKDRQRLQQETMRLWKQHGVNPVMGCLGPMLIQFPIWIALYYALIRALPTTPDSLLGLAQVLYPWLQPVHGAVPLNSRFLWLDLGQADSTPVLPLLVGASMWVQQKMSTYPTTDPRMQQQSQMMLWMMPLLFAFFTFQFPSGLAVYWVVSNLVGIVIQYFVSGWGGLLPQKAPAQASAPAQPAKERDAGRSGDKR